MIKRKKRKSRKAKNGTYESKKMGCICVYRSSWELAYMKYLDENDDVVVWKYEPFQIKYVSNIKTGKIRTYHPDLYVELKSGEKQLIEIKPAKKVHHRNVLKKTLAAYDWCRDKEIDFLIITEVELKRLGII